MAKQLHLQSRRCFQQNLNLTKETPETSSSQFEILSTLPKPNVFASRLSRCTRSFSFSSGLQIHAHVVKSGLLSDRFVGNSLLSLYFKLCPDFNLTRKVFDGLLYKDSVSWTSMVSGYVRVGKPKESLRVFREMLLHSSDVSPNGFTLSAVIKACSDCKDLVLGRCFHCVVLLRGFGWNHVVTCTLIDMYGRNHLPNDAVKVFEEMQFPDDIGWTSIISALTRNDRFEEALAFFHTGMHRKCCPGMVSDMFTFGSVLMALGNLGRSRQGKQVHAMVFTSGVIGNVVVESSLVDMYAKCGLISQSRLVFDRMPNKNAVSWCSLLNGYCQNGDYEVVLQMFLDMDVQDDGYSLSTVLRACASLSDMRRGKQVHCQFLRRGCSEDVIIESALVDLYAKCGLVDYAYRIFTKMKSKNLITWNAMICGFAKNSRAAETIEVFEKMLQKKQAMQPDNISFTGVLFACSHSGLVEEGKKYFTSMIKDYGIQPQIEHYNCMVDLLGRAELFEEAEEVIMRSPFRNDPSLWESFLGACASTNSYSNPSFAEAVAKKVIDLDPDYHLSYVLLANIYRSTHRWDDAVNVRRLMNERGLKKSSGSSWIGARSDSQSLHYINS